MRNKKTKLAFEIYGVLGKTLCACSGGITGFALGGPFIAILGIAIGTIAGHLLEKITLNSSC